METDKEKVEDEKESERKNKKNVKFLNANNEWYNGMCATDAYIILLCSIFQQPLNLKNPKMFDIYFFRILIK